MKKTAAAGNSHKHVSSAKHKGTAKHKPTAKKSEAKAKGAKATVKAKHPAHPKARALALGDAVACCSAEAVAASARLAGLRVTDDDVLALHWAAGGTADRGVPIAAALAAAARHGLAGCRPASFAPAGPAESWPGCMTCGFMMHESGSRWSRGGPRIASSGLILGLELAAGPHAVLADAGRWWSWSRPWPPSAFAGVTEECWAVAWS